MSLERPLAPMPTSTVLIEASSLHWFLHLGSMTGFVTVAMAVTNGPKSVEVHVSIIVTNSVLQIE